MRHFASKESACLGVAELLKSCYVTTEALPEISTGYSRHAATDRKNCVSEQQMAMYTPHRPPQKATAFVHPPLASPLSPQQCFVLSLGHLSSFLASARSRATHRAVSSLTKELKRDVLAAELAARDAVAAATAARAGAREASAEALEATARAAAAAASARNEGSLLLVEVSLLLAFREACCS